MLRCASQLPANNGISRMLDDNQKECLIRYVAECHEMSADERAAFIDRVSRDDPEVASAWHSMTKKARPGRERNLTGAIRTCSVSRGRSGPTRSCRKSGQAAWGPSILPNSMSPLRAASL